MSAETIFTLPWPRPARNRDTAFFWDGIDAGELRIQRCTCCGTLRHPARPVCAGCQSFEWDWIVSSGTGTIYSHAVAHHPPVPPFRYPHVMVLVALAEGTRILSSLVGADPADVRIGLPVELEITEVEQGLKLPLFRLSKARAA